MVHTQEQNQVEHGLQHIRLEGAHGRQEQVRHDSGIGRARCLKETHRPATRDDDQDEQSFLGAPRGRFFDLGFLPERLELF